MSLNYLYYINGYGKFLRYKFNKIMEKIIKGLDH